MNKKRYEESTTPPYHDCIHYGVGIFGYQPQENGLELIIVGIKSEDRSSYEDCVNGLQNNISRWGIVSAPWLEPGYNVKNSWSRLDDPECPNITEIFMTPHKVCQLLRKNCGDLKVVLRELRIFADIAIKNSCRNIYPDYVDLKYIVTNHSDWRYPDVAKYCYESSIKYDMNHQRYYPDIADLERNAHLGLTDEYHFNITTILSGMNGRSDWLIYN